MKVRVRATFSVQPSPWSSPLAGAPRWQFGDGRSAIGARVKHAYTRAGRYMVSVTQADAAGSTSTATTTITVTRRR